MVSACGNALEPEPQTPASVPLAKPAASQVKDEKQNLQALVQQARKLARGDNKQRQEAVVLFRKAADAGHPEGIGRLARAYRLGHGVERDYVMARKLYEKSIAAGYAAGKVGLGHMYRQGAGVEKDEIRACDLYRSAAELGVPGGMYYYGHCFEHGFGGNRPDPEEAVRWYRKALNTDKDYCYAYIGLARLYTRGVGVEKNLDEAAKIYKSGADRGCTGPERLVE